MRTRDDGAQRMATMWSMIPDDRGTAAVPDGVAERHAGVRGGSSGGPSGGPRQGPEHGVTSLP